MESTGKHATANIEWLLDAKSNKDSKEFNGKTPTFKDSKLDIQDIRFSFMEFSLLET